VNKLSVKSLEYLIKSSTVRPAGAASLARSFLMFGWKVFFEPRHEDSLLIRKIAFSFRDTWVHLVLYKQSKHSKAFQVVSKAVKAI
jgi:hypothetical protein